MVCPSSVFKRQLQRVFSERAGTRRIATPHVPDTRRGGGVSRRLETPPTKVGTHTHARRVGNEPAR
mgnify:CR=1 FL=1